MVDKLYKPGEPLRQALLSTKAIPEYNHPIKAIADFVLRNVREQSSGVGDRVSGS